MKLEGKIGDISFYISKYGPLARTIGAVSKERFHNDPKLARRKAAALDFGYVSSLGKLLRVGVASCCPLAEQGTTNQRLNAVLRAALKEDTDHPMGEKRITERNASALKGFNWRDEAPEDARLSVPLNVVLDAVAGTASLDIAALIPGQDVRMGPTIRAVDLSLVIAAVTQATKTCERVCDVIRIAADGNTPLSISLSCSLPAGSGSLWIAGVGVQGSAEIDGLMVAVPEESGFMVLESAVL